MATGGTEHALHHSAGDTREGLSLDSRGFVLSLIDAPSSTGVAGRLQFQIHRETGEPLIQFTKAHEKDLHLIVVRTDGSHFRHVHPGLDPSTGIWSVPWIWEEAGTYRIYADFTPADAEAGEVTLSRTVEVAGDYRPTRATARATDEVGGFTLELEGDLVAGAPSELTVSIARDGEPVTSLQPYLGAFGHLVALREGDLAYLHIHAEGESPENGQSTAGPTITFAAIAPTIGRYLLYLDFQVDGGVHTATFVLDAHHRPATDQVAG